MLPVKNKFSPSVKHNKPPRLFSGAALRSYSAAFSIVSMDTPYPLHGSFNKTCVTAPTIFPS